MGPSDELAALRQRVAAARLPDSVRERLDQQLSRMGRLSGGDFTVELDRTTRWIEWMVSLPWLERAVGMVDLDQARRVLDERHFGLEEVKERVLEYLAVLRLKQGAGGFSGGRAPILLLVGLVGTGKTTLASSVAEALERPMARIPFGGMGSARDLRGQSRLHLEAEPGQVIKAMRQVGVKNPVMLLDELDRVAEQGRSDVMGVLVELLDPEQNRAFLDHYLDVPFDLSEVLFICTANNTGSVATAVLDRMEPISMPSYSDVEKIAIGRQYLLPQALKEAGIGPGTLVIDEAVWPVIVRPLGYDAGIRTLQRTIQRLARQTAKAIVTGQRQRVQITPENVGNWVKTW